MDRQILTKYGLHRVIEPEGVLPQTADIIDNNIDKLEDNEILVDVNYLNIDSASFRQIEDQASGNEDKMAEIILQTVKKRGKQHNPVTGSGGVLMGKVLKIGKAIKDKVEIKEGDKIVTLVSLSLTPLKIDRIKRIIKEQDRVELEGKAIIFESGIYSKLPDDMPEEVAMAALDVAGAPAQTARLVQSGHIVAVIGAAGKSGLLILHEAKKRAGVNGKVIAIVHRESSVNRVKDGNLADEIIVADASKPIDLLEKFLKVSDGKLADVCINTVSRPNTEMGSILITKDRGIVYFFSMATSFTKAALGAEGIGKDVDLMIGNGYAKDHAKITFAVLRENPYIMDYFKKRYMKKERV